MLAKAMCLGFGSRTGHPPSAAQSLGGFTSSQFYYDPRRRLRIHGALRDRIFREIFQQFWPFAQ